MLVHFYLDDKLYTSQKKKKKKFVTHNFSFSMNIMYTSIKWLIIEYVVFALFSLS